MKKRIILLLAIILILFIVINKSEKEIRVRVIPNSNNEEDLLIKEEVKNFTLEYLKNTLCDSYSDSINNIKDTYLSLESNIYNSLGVTTSVSFDKHILYNKSYNDIALKDEECYCLYVVIENGLGDNWWGSVYPKFLSVSSSSEVEYKSFIYEWYKRMIG